MREEYFLALRRLTGISQTLYIGQKKELFINVLRIWRNGGWGKRENGGGGVGVATRMILPSLDAA